MGSWKYVELPVYFVETLRIVTGVRECALSHLDAHRSASNLTES